MGPADAVTGTLRVELVYSPAAGELQRLALTLPAGATLELALLRSGWALPEDVRFGIWGRLRPLTEPLRDGDRVECYRPLAVDPKEARRQRYRSHRKAGAR